MQILSGNAADLTFTFYDDDAPVSDLGPATVTVTDALGAQVDSETATPDADGLYSYTLPAQLVLGVLRIDWTTQTRSAWSLVEVVGAFLFDVHEARSLDAGLADLSRYSTDRIKDAREIVAAEFEAITGRSFVPRGVTRTVPLDDTGYDVVRQVDLRSITALSEAGVPQDFTGVTLSTLGTISGLPTSCTPGATALVSYTYGMDYPPFDVKRVAVLRTRYILQQVDNGIPDRATSFQTTDGGTYRLATPGRYGSETGIPEIDAVLSRYTIKPPGVA